MEKKQRIEYILVLRETRGQIIYRNRRTRIERFIGDYHNRNKEIQIKTRQNDITHS